MMLRAASAILLSSLLSQVNGLLTTDAKCLPGYDWTFSSIGQSPCDVAAELASVCAGGQFNLEPLDTGYVYAGPTQANQNTCRCSSVYYSLLSTCGYCQGRSFVRWTMYNSNCSTVYVAVYNQTIPAGVKVPAYAYQNVLVSDTFNTTLAEGVRGIESSGPSSSTTSSSASPSNGGGSGGNKNLPAIIGGVVGGIAFLGILAVLIVFFVVRSRRKQKKYNNNSSFQQSPKMAFSPATTATLVPPTMSPPLPTITPPPGPTGSPVKVYDPNDPSTYPTADPGYDPYRQHSSPFNQSMTPNYTGNSARHSLLPQTVPQNTGGHSQYTGVPEL